jgi:hypothetical protein
MLDYDMLDIGTLDITASPLKLLLNYRKILFNFIQALQLSRPFFAKYLKNILKNIILLFVSYHYNKVLLTPDISK